jgi:phytoene dehydrogenase-like protein
MLYILLILDWLNRGLAGYPVITSLGFSKVLAKKLTGRGGEIRYNSRVKKIIIEKGKAVGVTLDSNENIYGDYIINTASSPWSLNMMLPGFNIGKTDYTITPPLVHISYGTSYDFSGYESSACGLQLELTPPVKMAGEDRTFLLVHIYNFTKNLAPEGKTLVKVMFPSNYEYWNKLKQEKGTAYNDEKDKCSIAVLEAMDRYFPGFSKTIDMTDIASPVTFYRYTENQNGSLIAWGAVPATPMMLPKTIKGVSNLFLAGHWVMPGGGVPQAAMSARQAVQYICRKEKINI